MRSGVFLAILLVLAGCGGGYRYERGHVSQVTRLSTGPISRACLASGRKASNRQLCGCIQTVANLTMSRSDQKLAASFFDDPEKAQNIRQSSSRAHDRFWDRYTEFAENAKQGCTGY